MYAQVAVNAAADVEGVFDYHIPTELSGHVKPGHLVEVSFGTQKVQGVVLRLTLKSSVEETKPIVRLVDAHPILTSYQISLVEWLSETYLASISACMRLFVPPGLSRRGDTLIHPVIDPAQMEPKNPTQAGLLGLLARRGALRGRQIALSMPYRNWHAAIADLAERGLVLREAVLSPPAVNPKRIRLAGLAVPHWDLPAVIEATYGHRRRSKRQDRQQAVLHILCRAEGFLPVTAIREQIPELTTQDLRELAEVGLIYLREEETWRDPLAEYTFVPDQAPQLTPHQATTWGKIQNMLAEPGQKVPVLLHGVTGSGKTEIYLRAVEQALSQDRGAIVLIPEIALVPQTLRRFGARFGDQMGVLHSGLSQGERYDTWRRIRDGSIRLVIGARSALFAPLPNPGLVVLDECHDDSYKQSPSLQVEPPYYHAAELAEQLMRLNDGLVIMGSATPNVADYRAARQGQLALMELPMRIMGHRKAIESQAAYFRIHSTRYRSDAADADEAVMIELPPVSLVDMRQELRSGNRSIFSRALSAALQKTLDNKEQAILFLNRRGHATYVFCRDCGHVMTCPRCSNLLTWHAGETGQAGRLLCHQCNYSRQAPEECPACSSTRIRHYGGGTQKVMEEVKARFPDARPLQWDRDVVSRWDEHFSVLDSFITGEANVLVGTQMVAKGLDMPLVTLVGVISADTALYLPDFRSGERTFQLLTQVAGRAGRGLLGGKVVIQTYAPDHYAIQAAAKHDFSMFYQQEDRYRAQTVYPPYARLIRLIARGPDPQEVENRAHEIKEHLAHTIADRGLAESVRLIGPAPCFVQKIRGIYQWHIILAGSAPELAVKGLRNTQKLLIDVAPVSLL